MCWWLWLFCSSLHRAVHAQTVCRWGFSLADIRTTITGTAVRQSLCLPRRHHSLRVAAWLMNYHHINCWGTFTFAPQTPDAPTPNTHTQIWELVGDHSHWSTQRQMDNGSVRGCLALASWTAVLRLSDAACRTDVPCWHASYSEKERNKKEVVRKEAHPGPWKAACIHEHHWRALALTIPSWLQPVSITIRSSESFSLHQQESVSNLETILCLRVYLLPPSSSLHLRHILTCQTTLMLADAQTVTWWIALGYSGDCGLTTCHHGYAALTHAHQSNGLYVSLSPCIYLGTY